jgi:hypothetical protein
MQTAVSKINNLNTKHYHKAANWSDSYEGRVHMMNTIDRIRVRKAIKLYPYPHNVISYGQTHDPVKYD